MSESAGAEPGGPFARSRALAVLRVRGTATAVALLPAAVVVVLFAAVSTGRAVGPGWDLTRWIAAWVAALALAAGAAVAAVVVRARPAVTPTVPIAERTAPDLYRLVRELADRLDVPVPSAIALTPDCDSWLEDRTHRATRARGDRRRTASEPPVLVIGSPFLWWMRVAELRAVLAPVVAGTGPSAHPDIAAARRFVRGLDAAVAVSDRRPVLAPVGWVVRPLLRASRDHAAEMERGVAAAASARAQTVDYGLRIVAQEQVGLAYAGWDRLLTRVALPAWRMGRWPARLDAGVVSALTELSRRDRLAEGFASRLGERPACDLLEEPGQVDEAASLLAARLFHGGPAERGPDWAPVDWEEYPEEVVDRKWRVEAARLHHILDDLPPPDPRPTLNLTPGPAPESGPTPGPASKSGRRAPGASPGPGPEPARRPSLGPTLPDCPSPADTIAPATAPPPEQPPEPARAPVSGPVSASAPGGLPSPEGGPPREPGPAPAPAPDPGRTTAPDRPSAPDDSAPDDGPPSGPRPDPASATTAPTQRPASAPDAPSGTAAPASREPLPPTPPEGEAPPAGPTLARVVDLLAADGGIELGERLAARLGAELAREEETRRQAARTARDRSRRGGGAAADAGDQTPTGGPWGEDAVPLFPLQAPRTGRELLADHITAMVCCAAVDTAGAAPGMDWLDGPVLLLGGQRGADLAVPVLTLVEDGDPEPLRSWLRAAGVRPEKPVRLV